MIHAHKLEFGEIPDQVIIRPELMDEICEYIKKGKKPSGYTWVNAITGKSLTKAEASYIKLFGYCVKYESCVADHRISWGGERR